jgi:hypothetical protein
MTRAARFWLDPGKRVALSVVPRGRADAALDGSAAVDVS